MCTPARWDAFRRRSDNCYKVRLLLHWLGLAWTRIPVDFHPGREHRSAAFMGHINPRGQLPGLEDGLLRLPDAQAILVDLVEFPSVQAWISALRHQPGFLAMPGILDPSP